MRCGVRQGPGRRRATATDDHDQRQRFCLYVMSRCCAGRAVLHERHDASWKSLVTKPLVCSACCCSLQHRAEVASLLFSELVSMGSDVKRLKQVGHQVHVKRLNALEEVLPCLEKCSLPDWQVLRIRFWRERRVASWDTAPGCGTSGLHWTPNNGARMLGELLHFFRTSCARHLDRPGKSPKWHDLLGS